MAKAAYGAADEPERKIPRTIKVTKKAAAAARQKISPVKTGKPRGRAAAKAHALAAAATSVATPSPFSGVRYRRRTSIDDDDDADANDDEVDGHEDEDDVDDAGDLGRGGKLVDGPDVNGGEPGDSHGQPRGDDDDDDGDAGLIGRERFSTLRMEPVSPMKTHPMTVPGPTTTTSGAAAAVVAALQQHQLQQLHQFQQHALQQHQMQQYQHTLTQLHWQQMQVCTLSPWV
jgi:hypothetical protein